MRGNASKRMGSGAGEGDGGLRRNGGVATSLFHRFG
jgi:hypothetical protein